MNSNYYILKINQTFNHELDKLDFNNHYSLIKRFNINLFHNKQKKIIIGDSNVCAICGKSKAQGATFKNSSHVLPASLGNKWIFTKNECDTCNKLFGLEFEDNLAKMLLPDRVLYGIPKRHGLPSLCDNSYNTEFIVEKKNNVRILNVSCDENVFSPISINEGKIELDIPTQSYYPDKAVKAIVHSFWLSIDESIQKENQSILSWLKGNFDIFPIYYYNCIIPQIDDDQLSFIIYKKISDLEKLSNFICILRVAMNTLIFEIPDTLQKKYKPGLLPPILTRYIPNFEPHISYNNIKDSSQIKASSQKKELLFAEGKKFLSTKNNAIETEENFFGTLYYQKGVPQMINLVAVGNFGTLTIDHTYMKLIVIDDSELIEISGGTLTAIIKFNPYCTENTPIDIDLDFLNKSIDSIKETVYFLKSISSGAEITITNLIRKKDFFNLTINPSKTIISDIMMDYINKIYDISVYFKSNIYLKNHLSRFEYHILNIIHSAINKKTAILGDLSLSFTPLDRTKPIWEANPDTLFIQYPLVINFHGKVFDLGKPIIKVQEIFIDPKNINSFVCNPKKSIFIKFLNCTAYFHNDFNIKNAI